MNVKEESEKNGLKLNIQKMQTMVSGPITSWKLDGETMEIVTDLGLQNHCRWTVVLLKSLESPLDCKEIQPVHPKGKIF